MGWAKADPRADLRSSPLPPPQDGNHGLACSEADMAAGYAICRQAFEGQAQRWQKASVAKKGEMGYRTCTRPHK